MEISCSTTWAGIISMSQKEPDVHKTRGIYFNNLKDNGDTKLTNSDVTILPNKRKCACNITSGNTYMKNNLLMVSTTPFLLIGLLV